MFDFVFYYFLFVSQPLCTSLFCQCALFCPISHSLSLSIQFVFFHISCRVCFCTLSCVSFHSFNLSLLSIYFSQSNPSYTHPTIIKYNPFFLFVSISTLRFIYFHFHFICYDFLHVELSPR